MRIANRYDLGEQIGAGGMGAVFRGLDTQSGETVAIKRLKEDAVAQDSGLVQRFQREAEALRQLNHPNIVKVLATAEQDNQHFIVMEYMGGGSLKDAMNAANAALSIPHILSIALDLADALTRAHRLNIIHRDLKPANVLIAADGTPRLTDFGVARIGTMERVTGTGVAIGTLDYLPPEAINGSDVDARADIWAFGVMLFEMIGRHHPFEGESLGHTVNAILVHPTPDLEALRPDAPVALIDLVYRMLQKDREARISSVRLVGAELEAVMQALETGTLSTTARQFSPAPSRGTAFDTPTPSTNQLRHNLPAQTTPFVGRDAELAELLRALNDPNKRLVTILAPGGMGKTRLALEVAAKAVESAATTRFASSQPFIQFSNGVYFIALAPLSAPENIIPAIAEAVGFEFYPGGEPKDQLLDYFREKALLLVMDNFEHIVKGAGIVSDILAASPRVKIVATSRERLNLSGETVFNLGGLDFPDWKSSEEAFEYSAVKLFLQGAGRAQSGFQLQTTDLPAVARICRMVQGMPLGILLAAGWVEMLSLPEIADEISKSLDFLESEMRDVPERHRSIRAVFEYSWNLLSEEDCAVFEKLSVFRGGFTREAAQTITGAGLRPLAALVNKSLLRRDPDTGRYEVHELLRQYAEQRLKQKPEAERQVHEQHMMYYTDYLAAQGRLLWRPNESQVLHNIEADIENIRSAWNWALDFGSLKPIDNSLDALELFYEMRAMSQEGVETFGHLVQVLESKTAGENEMLLWRARARLSWLLIFLGSFDLSRELAETSLAFFTDKGWKEEHLLPLATLAYIAITRGEYEDAKHYSETQAQIGRELNNSQHASKGQASLGYVLFLQGKFEEARQIYREVIAEHEAGSPAYGISVLANNLGEILHSLREEEEAKALFEKSLAIATQTGHRRNRAIALNNLGNVVHHLGSYPEARRYYEDSLKIHREIGDRRGVADASNRLGNLGFGAGDYPMAKSYLDQAQTMYRQIGDRRGTANALTLLAFINVVVGESDTARARHEEALRIRRELGNREEIADSLVHLGMTAWNRGDYQESLRWIAESESLIRQEELNNSPVLTLCLTNRGIAFNELGDFQQALSACEASLVLMAEQHDPWGEAVTRNVIGDAWFGLANDAEAQQSYRHALRVSAEIGSWLWLSYSVCGFAMLLSKSSEIEALGRAVELFAFVESDEKGWNYIHKRASRYLKTIAERLPPDAYAAALNRGRAASAEALQASLLEAES